MYRTASKHINPIILRHGSRLLAQSISISFVTCLLPLFSAKSETAALPSTPSGFSCPVSECRMNQSLGTSSSVGVGVTSSFGVSATAQSTSNYNANSAASLVLSNFSPDTASQLGYNTSIQTLGNNASDAPISVKITSETVQAKSKDGVTEQDFSASNIQKFSSTNFSENGTSTSAADFTADGFGAMQDLRFQGGSASADSSEGSTFNANVIKLLDKVNGPELGTGSANSGAETRTRFQADITTSNFVNAFISSF